MRDCKRIELGHLTTTINGLWTGKKPPFQTVAVIRNTNFSKDCRLKMDDVAMIEVESKQFATRKLQVGDIIIEKSGGSDKQPVGRPVLFDIPEGDYSFSNFTSTLRVVDTSVILPEYLHKYLYKFYLTGKTAEMQSKTTGLRNLDFNAYRSILVPVPSLEVQSRIVSELNLISCIIDNKKNQIRDLDALVESLFYEFFGDPIKNEKGWPVVLLDSIAVSKIGLTYKPENVCNDGTIVLRSSNIQESEIDLNDIVRVNCPIKEDLFVNKGDILMCSRNGSFRLVGKVATIGDLPERMTYGAFMTIIRSKYNPYLFEFFKLPAFREQLGLAKTATINQITVKMLSNTRVALPPDNLQESFAHRVEKIYNQKNAIKQSIIDCQRLFDNRMSFYFD